MKRLTLLLLLLVSLHPLAQAQSHENLKRVRITTLEGFLSVNHGEFQAEHSVVPSSSTLSTSSYYNYLYVAKNEKSGMSDIFVDGKPLLPYKYKVRPFRIGSKWSDCVFAVKYFENDLHEIGYGMEVVYAYGVKQGICDSIISMTNDGYVFKLNNVYYFSTFTKGTTVGQTTPIVWPEKRIYKEEDRDMLTANGVSCKLSAGDVYHCSVGREGSNIHFYYLYRDKYMPQSLLVIDGRLIELFGNYTDDNFKLKYSHNGMHWMAVADGRFWVDGEMKSIEGYTISDFLISNSGDYVYKARKNGEEEKGETLVMNGEIIRRQVIIGHFTLNAQQRLRFHFLAGGQWYVYDNGQISSVEKESNSVLYTDDLIDNLVVDRLSSNGMHKLSYVSGREGVEIDGMRMTESVPFQVVYDKNEKSFKWNAIEINSEGRTDLVIYTYSL